MGNHNKPRHIRDIAHLYLSRLPEKSNRHRVLLYIAASAPNCFGAFHATNIALSFQQRGYRVRLIELSGVLPCCAYFLGLPPRVYLKQKKEFPDEELSALGGVSIRFAPPETAAGGHESAPGVPAGFRRRPTSRIDIVHLPPVLADRTAGRAFRSTGPLLDAFGVDRVRAVVLAPDDHGALVAGGRLFGARNTVDWVTLSVQRNPRTEVQGGKLRQSLGYLAGWRALLSDPLPCVVRDPDSHVSRSYYAVSEALFSRPNATRESHDATERKPSESAGRLR
jgi:hypothetical protein